MAWIQFASASFAQLQRTYVRRPIGIATTIIISWPMRCTAVLCAWRIRSAPPSMIRTLLLPESGQTSKLFSKCCTLERTVWKNLHWRKHRRLADRVHRSTKYRTTSAACPTLHTMKVPQPYTGDSQSVRSDVREANSRIRTDRYYKNN